MASPANLRHAAAKANGPPPRRKTTRTTRGKALGNAWHAQVAARHRARAGSHGRLRRSSPRRHRCQLNAHARCQARQLGTHVRILRAQATAKPLIHNALRRLARIGFFCHFVGVAHFAHEVANRTVAPTPLFGLLSVVRLRRQKRHCCFSALHAARGVFWSCGSASICSSKRTDLKGVG